MNRAERRGFKGKQIDNVLTRADAFVGVMIDRKTGTLHLFHDLDKCKEDEISGDTMIDTAKRLQILCRETNRLLGMSEKEIEQAARAEEYKKERSKLLSGEVVDGE